MQQDGRVRATCTLQSGPSLAVAYAVVSLYCCVRCAGRPLFVGVRPLQLWPLLLCKAVLKVMAALKCLDLGLPNQVGVVGGWVGGCGWVWVGVGGCGWVSSLPWTRTRSIHTSYCITS
jgi:hypothetical protein